MQRLTNKQETFAQKFVETGVASDAYREAYNTDSMLTKTIWEKASLELNKDKVWTRIEELQGRLVEEHDITTDGIVSDLRWAIRLAKRTSDASNIRGAAMDLAKLCGLITDKSVNTNINLNQDVSAKQQDVIKRRDERMKETLQ